VKPGALFSVSVDLDGIGCYAAIHGNDPRSLTERAMRAVPEVALVRLCELFEQQSIRATFFSIGQELSIPMAKETLARAHAAGHEIASHSFAHDYALSRRSQPEIEDDLQRAEAAIEAAVGQKPRGFRAPGYTLSSALVAALRSRGYAYDSSLLPSPPYYLAKALAIGMHALRGKKSHSILGHVGQLFGPRAAHELDGLRELPVSTLPIVGMPIIGTVVTAVSESLAGFLSERAFAGGHFNLELHGIDVLDVSDTDLPALGGVQPGLNVPAKIKLQRLAALLGRLRSQAESCTLEEASTQMFPA
jgi:peptidoglycan/xylan/chitin deacetylase (PgdA/CDA1 family)